MDDDREMGRGVARRKTASNLSFCIKKEKDGKYRKVYAALQKKDADLTEEERQLVQNNADLVIKARESLKKREEVKARSEEVEDPDEVLLPKCVELASALRNSRHLVVYTGAGISTAAKIPDYRGSNGIWTLLQKGKDIGNHDLSRAEPTLTHMALFELYSEGILKYVVSQNCDGLHLRSGLPRSALSEVHGNMHLEVCPMCRPTTQYWRMFDVTENTGRFSHRTMRRCHMCHSALIDTIVHFGERGNLPWPLNWPAASKAADSADTILCIGSSLKVLKKYPWLWGMDKPVRKRPKLYIINLQWTPKDDHAVLKINGRCDRVMQEVMKCLNLKVPDYSRLRDPIFCHATHLHPDEIHTTSQPELDSPFKKEQDEPKTDTTVHKQGVKRGIAIIEVNCPIKMRKVDLEGDILPEVKQELQNNFYDKEDRLHQLVENIVNQGNPSEISSFKVIEDCCLEGSLFFCKSQGMNQEPLHSDHVSMIIPVSQLTSVEEPNKSLNDEHLDSKGLPVVIKEEEGSKSSDFSCGQNVALSGISEHTMCSKVNVGADLNSVDGKENVAVCFSKLSVSETFKTSKKSDAEKLSEISDSEKSPKSHIVGNGVHSAKVEPLLECFTSLKSQKGVLKNNVDAFEDEVVVLKMLQLEHNYSKSLIENQEEKCSNSSETVDVRKDSKILKSDFKLTSKEAVKRNLRRTSRDAVNYLEVDEEEDEEEGSGSDNNAHSSVSMSERMQSKHDARHQTEQEMKLSAKQQIKGDIIKSEPKEKGHEKKQNSGKSNKPITPLKNKKLTKADFEMRAELKVRACTFCINFYRSNVCMFYPSLDFHPRKFEGCICECCDYSSDSEEADEEGSNGEANEGKGDSTDNAEEGTSKSSIVNPGWYGKGYRKRLRKKK